VAFPADDKSRHIIPRWRDSQTTFALGEMAPLDQLVQAAGGPSSPPPVLDKLRAEFQAAPGPAFAGDLLSTASALGMPEFAEDVAKQVLTWNLENLRPLEMLARRVLKDPEIDTPAMAIDKGEVSSSGLWSRIATLKRRLRRVPRSAFDWVDAALLYESIGQRSHAERAIRAALSLSPTNRFVLRSASRFWVHRNEYGRAHDLLSRAAGTRRDPWLLAAEIATAGVAGRPSRFIRAARGWVESGRLDPRHASEMASAVGTVELASGSVKMARRLFRASLQRPTENAIAQAAWADRRFDHIFSWEGDLHNPTRSAEADAIQYLYVSEWDKAMAATNEWLLDQPFSARPIINGSFIYSTVKDEYKSAIALCQFGLLSNPEDVVIRNNLAFALCLDDRPADAERALKPLSLASVTSSQQAMLLATLGLIAFRRGHLERGRALYSLSIEIFERIGSAGMALRARLYWMCEETRLGNVEARDSASKIIDSIASDDFGLKAVAIGVRHRLAKYSQMPVRPSDAGGSMSRM
jgi:Tfp pilus assembly protein PilF